jgi:hypothetical protein
MSEKRWSYPDDDTGRVLSLMAEKGFYHSPKCRLPWTCECSRVMVPTYTAVVAAEQEVDELGRRFGGFGDGFGSSGGIWWGVRNNT